MNHDDQIFWGAQVVMWVENVDMFSVNHIPQSLVVNAEYSSCADMTYNMPLVKMLVPEISCGLLFFLL